MPLYQKGEIMTPMRGLFVTFYDDNNKIKAYKEGDLLLLLKYVPKHDSYCKYIFIDQNGIIVSGGAWLEHLTHVQFCDKDSRKKP